MNRHALEHITDSAYCYPVSDSIIEIRMRTARDDFEDVWIIYESKYVYGDRQKKKLMTKSYTSELYDFYTIRLELSDTRLAYIFYLHDRDGYYFFSEDGITATYKYELGFYNFFQYPFFNRADIHESVEWMKTAVFYQIFVDRFNMGDDGKDKSYINIEWGEKPNPKSFAGGDIRGIINKLDYISELGVNAIYLTPIFKSISNHKYDISDYMCIDEQFGSKKDLRELVNDAHSRGIRVVLDAVFNHCSEDFIQFQDVLEKGRKSPYYDWFIIYGDKPEPSKGNYEMFAQCEYMPKLNTSNEEVQKYLCDIGVYYIEKFDIDGWRLDVSDEVSHDFWRRFRKEIKSAKKDAVIIGENWHNASNYLRGDQYDGIMNYAFTKCCLDFFAAQTMDAQFTAWKLNDILMRNTKTANDMMMNLLDSHDTHRFFSEVECNREKIKSALCLLFMYPGAPCIFYGTEILIQGGYDPDCRKCMDWDKTSDESCEDMYTLIRELSMMRKKYNFASGDTFITAEDGVLIVTVQIKDIRIELYINGTNEDKMIEKQTIVPFGHLLKWR